MHNTVQSYKTSMVSLLGLSISPNASNDISIIFRDILSLPETKNVGIRNSILVLPHVGMCNASSKPQNQLSGALFPRPGCIPLKRYWVTSHILILYELLFWSRLGWLYEAFHTRREWRPTPRPVWAQIWILFWRKRCIYPDFSAYRRIAMPIDTYGIG